jgi:hypothetical protein
MSELIAPWMAQTIPASTFRIVLVVIGQFMTTLLLPRTLPGVKPGSVID